MSIIRRPLNQGPLPQSLRKTAFGLACVMVALASAGCGRGSWENDDNYAPFTPHAAPSVVSNKITLGSAAAPPAGPDPQLSRGGDPLVQVSDPLAADHQAQASAGSRLANGADPGASESGAATQGWYWVVGSIQSGQVEISVNGVPIGRYSVHVDQEITKYCHAGLNTLTFTHYPLRGSPQQICAAHLEILNGHAPKGAPPLMVYDTSDEIAAAAPAAASPSAPVSAEVLTPDGNDPDSGSPNDQAATTPAPASTPVSSTPYSEERSFSGA